MSRNNIIEDFPLLTLKQAKKPFVYLDSAATSQKPKSVIEAEKVWYERFNANIHRGVYDLAENATKMYEGTRGKVANFINAANPKSISFNRGATAGINTVVQAWVKYHLQAGDIIVLTEMEHHANIVPWQILAAEKKLKIRYWPIDNQGNLADVNYDELFANVKILSLTHVSNVLGTINPVKEIIQVAHKHGVKVLVDAAQSVGHRPIDVTDINPDWLVFSAHKLLGPTGLGVLYTNPDLFSEMQPYEVGGDMIREVKKISSIFKPMPWLLEAGTQPLAQVFALGEAIDYLSAISLKKIQQHDELLVKYLYNELNKIPTVKIFGPDPSSRSGLVSFVVDNIHAHDLATVLNEQGICIRAGHHCAQILHDVLAVPATVRVSVYIYNTKNDIDYFIKNLNQIIHHWNKI